MIDLSGKTVLITGASGGIGCEIAKVFSKVNANVIIHCHKNIKKARSLQAQLNSEKTMLLQADLLDRIQVSEMFNTAKLRFNNLDILVNNAGIMIEDSTIESIDLNKWQKPLTFNVISLFNCVQEAIPLLKKSKQPRIINVSSIGGDSPLPKQSSYGASKAAIINLTKTISVELSPHILVNCVSPGLIDTGMRSNFSNEDNQKYIRKIPLKRLGTAKEVANLVVFLASDLSSYITGKNFMVDGGLT